MVVAEFKLVGVVSEELYEKVVNCIKGSLELTFPNEKCLVDGLTVEVNKVD